MGSWGGTGLTDWSYRGLSSSLSWDPLAPLCLPGWL